MSSIIIIDPIPEPIEISYDTVTMANLVDPTIESVEALSYEEVVALAGVAIAADGSCPEDFFYQAVKASLKSALKMQNNASKIALLQKFLDSTSGFEKSEVTSEGGNRISILWPEEVLL